MTRDYARRLWTYDRARRRWTSGAAAVRVVDSGPIRTYEPEHRPSIHATLRSACVAEAYAVDSPPPPCDDERPMPAQASLAPSLVALALAGLALAGVLCGLAWSS